MTDRVERFTHPISTGEVSGRAGGDPGHPDTSGRGLPLSTERNPSEDGTVNRWLRRVGILTTGLALLGAAAGEPARASGKLTFRITLENLAEGQPLSPPVAAAHSRKIAIFERGAIASPELEALAEDGNQIPLFDLLAASRRVRDVIDLGAPLFPAGQPGDAATFDLKARAWDKLSLATMLICTNDGFAGLDAVDLPWRGSSVFWLNAYDGGTEDNTERTPDIVDPCGAIGPVAFPPDGNENDAVDTMPRELIAIHPNIQNVGDLVPPFHSWVLPIARVTVTRVGVRARRLMAELSGVSEVPYVPTVAMGAARLGLKRHETQLEYRVHVSRIINVIQAHIHLGMPNENGPVVAFLFGPASNTGVIDGRLAEGTIEEADLLGPLAGDFEGFVDALRNGELYVNVHTLGHPSGEIRGQIGAR